MPPDPSRTKGTTLEHRRFATIGIAAIGLGVILGVAGALFAHFTGLDELNALGDEIYPAIPRGWVWQLIGQLVSLTGVFLVLGGTALGYLYKREMTWARASVGALLFVALSMILFGIIPNEWLTLTQATWEWTPQKIAFTLPSWLVLNNDVSISLAAVKDIVSGTYAVVALGGVAVGMYQWQEWQKRAASGPPPQPVSTYGRPVNKVRG